MDIAMKICVIICTFCVVLWTLFFVLFFLQLKNSLKSLTNILDNVNDTITKVKENILKAGNILNVAESSLISVKTAAESAILSLKNTIDHIQNPFIAFFTFLASLLSVILEKISTKKEEDKKKARPKT